MNAEVASRSTDRKSGLAVRAKTRRKLSRVVVKGVRRDDHVDGCGLGLLSRRRARRRGGAALLGPALRVFLHILELATLLEAF